MEFTIVLYVFVELILTVVNIQVLFQSLLGKEYTHIATETMELCMVFQLLIFLFFYFLQLADKIRHDKAHRLSPC